ncbi:MAG TPA: YkgJ family cysteine cluster protein [Candidatus Acidoferrales bacterium]|nr:YkgJ family cysteine cluster protein [Candidatus Acidoferrales bacterium]
MNRSGRFSYLCNACGRCCHDKVIALSPYDVMEIARAAKLTTNEAVSRYTIRRGSILRFRDDGRCVALDGIRCSLHGGRPLACRLYPLGIARGENGTLERFVTLEPAAGSRGVYGNDSTVAEFLAEQGVGPHLEAIEQYAALLPTFRERVAALVDFSRVEPREFWRRARREALAESGYDANELIDAIFDADRAGSASDVVAAHVRLLEEMIRRESNPDTLAAAAVMLAVSLGYSPDEVARA